MANISDDTLANLLDSVFNKSSTAAETSALELSGDWSRFVRADKREILKVAEGEGGKEGIV